MFKRTASVLTAAALVSGAAAGIVAVGAGSASAATNPTATGTPSASSARTVYCYKSAGNNGSRLKLNFADTVGTGGKSLTQGNLVATVQNWNGSFYADTGVTRTVPPSIGYQTGNAGNLCTVLANSFFLGGQLDGYLIGAFG
ncbi:hypothetical protein [Williamsia sp. CHRR-6]|uniref:hypothetical protein n=1 Tax=Williamsia sp. CHRR-6 TaxID=2835871 RepID=UPI001BDB22AB|nr:hypothetical protein [Williamsia sp. CHRR-6]MBT0567403.1 hypothetical protein [Williamsia sp. CHRR-6]